LLGSGFKLSYLYFDKQFNNIRFILIFLHQNSIHNMSEEKKESPPPNQSEEQKHPNNKKKPGMVAVTRVVLLLSVIVFIWYIYADRITPYTDQARITELIQPITPRVSGYVTDVRVKLNSVVKANDILFGLDTTTFVLNINKAKANLDNATQQIGAQGANVQAAASSVGVAKAQLDRAQRSYDRTQRILSKNPGAVSQADIDRVETSLSQATEKLYSAEANLVKAQEQLGATGNDNAQLRLAISELEKAELDYSYTTIYAANDGFIESFNIDIGYYAQAGQPLATLVSKQDIWIQADFKENNLSNMKVGDQVLFILDVAPGKIFEGKVRGIGHGVESGNPVNRGGLPSIGSTSTWLRDPQRFPVTIAFDNKEAFDLCRAGGQADVVVLTGNHKLLNRLAHWRIWINTWLSYVR